MPFEPTQFEPSGFPFDSTDFAMTIASPTTVIPTPMPTMDWEDDDEEESEEETTPVEIDPDLEDEDPPADEDELGEDVDEDDDGSTDYTVAVGEFNSDYGPGSEVCFLDEDGVIFG